MSTFEEEKNPDVIRMKKKIKTIKHQFLTLLVFGHFFNQQLIVKEIKKTFFMNIIKHISKQLYLSPNEKTKN